MKTVHSFLALVSVGVVLAGTVASWEAAGRAVAAPHEASSVATTADGARFALALQSPSTQPAGPKEAHQRHAKPVPGTPAVAHDPEQPKSGQSVVITVKFVNHPAPDGPLLLEY
jgi:hypothetical protein